MLLLLALAIAPGLAICLFIYAMDKYDKEPLGLLIRSFLLGILCVCFPLVIQFLAMSAGLRENPGSIAGTAIFAYAVVGLSEELGKFLVLRYYAYPKPAFNEPYDGIVYAVMVGMGFATAENIVYVLQYGVGTGIARMFLSVPAHATFAILMGHYAGLAKFKPGQSGTYLFYGLFLAVFFHGTFDFFLFLGNNLLLLGGSLVSLYIGIRLSVTAVKKHRALSRSLYESDYFNNIQE
ncbi:PrsW family glutamic-type intramembrane protease [Chitinophaga defluvii]|uniref:Protease PrsW n=1 Tax=Chitinophaga defluvii TaxID=3163343 RepID=A0ABV2T5X6_9BACT